MALILPLSLILCAAVFALSTPTQAQQSSQLGSELSAQLSGHIEHALVLPPVNPNIQVGRRFDERNLSPHDNADTKFWWHVPDWLSGSWHNIGRIHELSFVNLKTHESYETKGPRAISYAEHEVIGLQTDRLGEVWTCVPTPYVSKDRVGNILNVNMINLCEPLKTADDQVVLKLLATTLMVDSSTKEILAVTQREAIQTYKPVAPGKILILASNRFFDEFGQPEFSRDLLTHCRKQSEYVEQEYWTSPGTGLSVIDLRRSFADYLHENHLDKLIPDAKLAHHH